jgi:hypothetical protein
MTNPTTRTLGRDDWMTPPEVFNPVNDIVQFDLDACAIRRMVGASNTGSRRRMKKQTVWSHSSCSSTRTPTRRTGTNMSTAA